MSRRTRALPTELPADSVEAIKRFAIYPRPKLFKLRPPASEADVRACEEKLECSLPAELRAVLLVHDGLVELEHNKYDLLGGTRTLPMLRRAFLDDWKDLVVQFEYGPPFEFGPRYFVLGGILGIWHEFVMLDTERRLDGHHPVIHFNFDDGLDVKGFASLTHYLQWAFLHVHDNLFERMSDMFPERYSAFKFRKMMKGAAKVP